jgi:hypothetical protein
MSFGIKFFEPDTTMLQWLKEYANGRLILDVGAGEGHITRGLHKLGAKVMGLEPMGDYDGIEFMNTGVRIMPWRIEDQPKFFVGLKDKVLLLFARPCHSDFVINTLDLKDDETEVLYITLEENLTHYDDLGEHKDRAVLVEHKGTSKEQEVVYSIR